MAAFAPGQRAYNARFGHLPERHYDAWYRLDPVAKAIWVRVEAACQPAPAAEDEQAVLVAYQEAYAAAFARGQHHQAHCAGLRAVIRLMRGGAA